MTFIWIVLMITGCLIGAASGTVKRQRHEELIRAVKEQGKKD